MVIERKMFYGASASLFAKAKQLRENMTDAEIILWERLKENKLGVRFKPQHPIRYFIADFYCHALNLIIEIDGEIHDYQREYDSERTEILNNHGITVLRFTNDEVVNKTETVINEIKSFISSQM